VTTEESSERADTSSPSTAIHSTAREGARLIQDKRGWVLSPLTQMFEHPLSSPEWWIEQLRRQQRISGN